MRPGHALPCAVLVACSLAWGGAAHAEPAHHVALRWHTADGCIDGPTLASTVEHTLGRPVFHGSDRPAATVEATIGADPGGGFRAVIRTVSASGDTLAARRITTDTATCDRLDDAAAVVVALMVDDVQEPAAGPHLPPAPAPSPAPKPTPLRLPAAPPRAFHATFGGEAGFGAAPGLLPRPSAGAYARGVIDLGRWSVAVAFDAWLPAQAADGAVGARIWAFTGEAGGCFSPVLRHALRVEACVVAGGGATEAAPQGLVDTRATELPVAFAGPELALAFRVGGPVWVTVRVAARALLGVPEYVYRGDGGAASTLFRAAPVVPVLTFGLGAREDS